jgi:hypothetical protein
VTVWEGEDVRTGVTAIIQHDGNIFQEKVPAALVVGNGFGKLVGVTQIRELGEMETPILLTCTLCVWRAADAMVEWLLEQDKDVTGSVIIDEACHLMRASRELRHHKHAVHEADALVVLACGSGVQSLSSNVEKRVVGGLNSMFLGNVRRFGQYEEMCSLCGDCILNETAGICPVTACHKGLLNGPCGGTNNGMCEIDSSIDCAWTLIYNRLKQIGRLDLMRTTCKPKNFHAMAKPGKVDIVIEGG